MIKKQRKQNGFPAFWHFREKKKYENFEFNITQDFNILNMLFKNVKSVPILSILSNFLIIQWQHDWKYIEADDHIDLRRLSNFSITPDK